MSQAGATPQVSVIVPVYNVADYLPQCLDSLLSQTLEDIEVVCVNDGSTDASGQVLAGYAQRDSRIKVLDKPNGGVSSARNAGLRAASADIVSFLDADDFYLPHACQTIASMLQGTGADMLTFNIQFYPDDGGDSWLTQHLTVRDAVYAGFDPKLVFGENALPYPRTACRRDFLLNNGICFDEDLRLGEDELFYLQAYPRSRATVLLSDQLYVYRTRREGSAMAQQDASGFEALSQHMLVVDKAFDSWHQLFPDGRYAAQLLHWSVEYALYGAFCLSEPQRGQLMELYAQALRKHWTAQQLQAMGMSKADLHMVQAAAEGQPVTDARARKLRFDWQAATQGLASAALHAAKSVLG